MQAFRPRIFDRDIGVVQNFQFKLFQMIIKVFDC